jgi:hypothetical protein
MNHPTDESQAGGLFIGLFIMFLVGIVIIIIMVSFNLTPLSMNKNCVSDDKHFTKTGIVTDVLFLGDCNMITFNDSSVLYLHGSPNEKYDLYEIDNLLAVGVNYTFSYHHECVMSDGNEIWYHQGNVIDKIVVNNKELKKK